MGCTKNDDIFAKAKDGNTATDVADNMLGHYAPPTQGFMKSPKISGEQAVPSNPFASFRKGG